MAEGSKKRRFESKFEERKPHNQSRQLDPLQISIIFQSIMPKVSEGAALT